MNYFELPQTSNSDLTSLKNMLRPPAVMYDTENVFPFGNLLDAVITEPHLVDFHKRIFDSTRFKKTDFNKAEKMKNSFLKDDFCRYLIKGAEFQKVIITNLKYQFKNIESEIEARCKWDIIRNEIKLGADVKSTGAQSQNQFLSAVEHFDYDRQSAWYMDLTGVDEMVIIGISKQNYKVFKVFINRNSELYISGKDKYSYLCYKKQLLGL